MEKILEVLTDDNPILRKISKDIAENRITTIETEDLIDSMVATMRKNEGIGLAAPQIGKNIRLVVINTKEGALAFF